VFFKKQGVESLSGKKLTFRKVARGQVYDSGRIISGGVHWECLVDPAFLGGVLGGGVEGVWGRLEKDKFAGIQRVSEVGGDGVCSGSPVKGELLAGVTVDGADTDQECTVRITGE
jgi:hypothetical protein